MTETANVALECTEFVIVAFVFRSIESFKNVELRETHTHNRDFDRTEEEEDKKKNCCRRRLAPNIFFPSNIELWPEGDKATMRKVDTFDCLHVVSI